MSRARNVTEMRDIPFFALRLKTFKHSEQNVPVWQINSNFAQTTANQQGEIN